MGFLALEIAQAVGGWWVSGPKGKWIRGVSIDSREPQQDRLFIALPGEHTDGHQFVNQSLQRGSAGALVARSGDYRPAPGQVLIRVTDTLQALGAWSRWHRRRLPVTVVGVTGSCGKTTTKALIEAVLTQVASTYASPGNFNTEIGVPLALLNLKASHRFAVIEMGMRGKGQLRLLSELSQPFVGVITNIGVSHAAMFRDLQEIADTKAELLDSLPTNGAAVLNRDNPHFQRLRERVRCRLFTFGIHREAQVRADEIRWLPPQGMRFRLRLPSGEGEQVRLQIPGEHNVMNALAAAAAGYALHAPLSAIVAGLESATPLPMRSQVIHGHNGLLLLHDAYNAAPSSMAGALAVLVHLPARRHGAVLGDMKELGELSHVEHLRVGRLAAELGIDYLVTVGEEGALIAEGARAAGFPASHVWVCHSNQEAIQVLQAHSRAEDAVLVKGSRAMGMEEIVDAFR